MGYSALLSAEYALEGLRGRYGMFTLLGGGTAAVLSSATFLGGNAGIGEGSPAFMQWGWLAICLGFACDAR